MIDIYSKAAITVAAKFEKSAGYCILLTSSSGSVDCVEVGKKLTAALCTLNKRAVFTDLSQKSYANQEEADTAVTTLFDESSVAVIASKSILESESAMLLTSACKSAILVERRRVSRTDQIEEATAVLQNLNATTLGFILL